MQEDHHSAPMIGGQGRRYPSPTSFVAFKTMSGAKAFIGRRFAGFAEISGLSGLARNLRRARR
jgi:hypothetical protein